MRDDDELPAAIAADLDGCFERLVRAFQDRLYAFALGFTPSPQDAEEVTQDTFARAYGALRRYPAERRRTLALRPWLYRITLNVARNRARVRRLALEPLDTSHDVADEGAEQPEAQALRGEQRRDLAALVRALPDRYRAAVVLRHVQGLSYAEVAAILEQPVGTTKSDVHRGIRLLRATVGALEEVA